MDQIQFIADLNNAIVIMDTSRDVQQLEAAIQLLDSVAFQARVPWQYKQTALEVLLRHVPYHAIAEKVTLLTRQVGNSRAKHELEALVARYQSLPTTTTTNGEPSLANARGLWKRGRLEQATNQFKQILLSTTASQQEKLTAVHTMVNDCYNPERREAIADMLDDIYTFMQDSTVKYASIRDLIVTIFRLRNIKLQETNNRVFKEHMNQWAGAGETVQVENRILGALNFFPIYKAWRWVCDAIEFARDAGKETLWNYLTTWITEPPFHQDLPPREHLKYQFFACEYLLQSYRPAAQRIAGDFLINVAESNEYSTFVRGDALDVMIRNPIPADLQPRLQAVREVLRTLREDEERNMRLQQQELGRQRLAGGEPGFGRAIVGTTYDDSQNVHALAVNEAIKESILNMTKDPEVRGNTIYKVAEDIEAMITEQTARPVTQRNRAIAAISRYIEDPSVFTEKRIKLGAVLVLVWNRIIRHNDRDELYGRLIEELAAAYNTCATGHVSRAVSVLVGYYPDIKQFTSFETQLENNIKARISAAIRNAPADLQDDLLAGMIDTVGLEYQAYQKFLAEQRQVIHEELFPEFVPQYLDANVFEMIMSKIF